MARTNYKDVFKKNLVDFIGEEDPILAMLEWTAQRMMEIESEAKVGAKNVKEWGQSPFFHMRLINQIPTLNKISSSKVGLINQVLTQDESNPYRI